MPLTHKKSLCMRKSVSITYESADFLVLLSNVENPVDPDEAPSGMMARGHYEAVSKFQDDDKHDYLKFEWSFDITKDWK